MFYLISRYFSMIVQTVKFPVITTMTRTERTVAQVIAIVSGTDRMDIFYDGPPRKAKKKITPMITIKESAMEYTNGLGR